MKQIIVSLLVACAMSALTAAAQDGTETSSAPASTNSASAQTSVLSVVAGKKYYYLKTGQVPMDLTLDANGVGTFGYWPKMSRTLQRCRGEWPATATVRKDGKIRVDTVPPPGTPAFCGTGDTNTRSWTFEVLDGGERLLSGAKLEFKTR